MKNDPKDFVKDFDPVPVQTTKNESVDLLELFEKRNGVTFRTTDKPPLELANEVPIQIQIINLHGETMLFEVKPSHFVETVKTMCLDKYREQLQTAENGWEL